MFVTSTPQFHFPLIGGLPSPLEKIKSDFSGLSLTSKTMALTNEGRYLFVTGTKNNTIMVFDFNLQNRRCERVLFTPSGYELEEASIVEIQAQNAILIAHYDNDKLVIFNLENEQITGLIYKKNLCAFSYHEGMLAVVYGIPDNYKILCWDIQNFEPIPSIGFKITDATDLTSFALKDNYMWLLINEKFIYRIHRPTKQIDFMLTNQDFVHIEPAERCCFVTTQNELLMCDVANKHSTAVSSLPSIQLLHTSTDYLLVISETSIDFQLTVYTLKTLEQIHSHNFNSLTSQIIAIKCIDEGYEDVSIYLSCENGDVFRYKF